MLVKVTSKSFTSSPAQLSLQQTIFVVRCQALALETTHPRFTGLYWLVYRDPYIGLLKSPYNWVVFHPLYNLNNQGVFIAHIFPLKFPVILKELYRYTVPPSEIKRTVFSKRPPPPKKKG